MSHINAPKRFWNTANSSDEEGSQTSEDGPWPAPAKDMEAARTFLKECALKHERTLILPDKDADGLCASLIIYRTLVLLGLPPTLFFIHFVVKGSNIHNEDERERMQAYGAKYVIAVDQGSRGGAPLVGKPGEFSGEHLHPPVASRLQLQVLWHMYCADLCIRINMKWVEPWPAEDMKTCVKTYTKQVLSDVVRLVNAPRRTASYDVSAAWQALLYTTNPRTITAALTNSTPSYIRRLYHAQGEVKAETDRWTHSAPKFSGDGRIALIRISSSAQIHPLIATRWANTLKSSKLEIVMCANDTYLPGSMTNFSCRVARCASARSGGNAVDIIDTLKEYASRVSGLREGMGDNFARGHKEASGGIVRTDDFERLWGVMLESQPAQGQGESPKRKKRKSDAQQQSNTLEGWIKKGVETSPP
ncbi:hypothetical protein EUX98_g8386 [Antrodiella citrinella]|uniref:Uncharacterized protein n=1 Tax=Antrodiella citrinella TaxID=2447956 RepID=A0A4V3XGH6_9APHY|nr:hypothetical protein EUX98_g8386 [Antrodiella citrinella]